MAFPQEIERQVEKLRNKPLKIIESEVAAKRLAWFKPFDPLKEAREISPRKAYELFFFEYLGLSPKDVPIISESENEIEWASINPCPTLEACKILGLDTRKVCRGAYERSTQALISQLDPQLRFSRSYAEIRPYAQSCRERIIRLDFESLMQIAIQEAFVSKKGSNQGTGALVVLGNQILARTHDSVNLSQDPGQHAESLAIQQVTKVLEDPNLCGAVLVSTCEPCPACFSLANRANFSAIVYGLTRQEVFPSKIPDPQTELEQFPITMEVFGNILPDPCRSLYD